jgi:membrane protein implicated in regulation of membrane protease activity
MAGPFDSRTALKYALVQLPSALLVTVVAFGLHLWAGLPGWLVWASVAAWIVKDILLFPTVRRAYEAGEIAPGSSMVGACGTARERLAPDGYVQMRGELWQAEVQGGKPVEAGQKVRVLRLRGLVLLVEPAGCEENPAGR